MSVIGESAINLSWELAFGLGAFALLAAIVYGMLRARRRTPEERRVQEQRAQEWRAKDIYDHPASCR